MLDDLAQLTGQSPALLVLAGGAILSALGAVLLAAPAWWVGQRRGWWK